MHSKTLGQSIPFSQMKEITTPGDLFRGHTMTMELLKSNPETRVFIAGKPRRGQVARLRGYEPIDIEPSEYASRMTRATHCALCGEPFRIGQRKEFDHDHETGKPRGVVCSRCNKIICYAELFAKNLTIYKRVCSYLVENK